MKMIRLTRSITRAESEPVYINVDAISSIEKDQQTALTKICLTNGGVYSDIWENVDEVITRLREAGLNII